MESSAVELAAEMLRRICKLDESAFVTTDDVDRLVGIVGQERATRAIEFGINMRSYGYNIFVMGPSGAGKTSTMLGFLKRKAAERETPQDWAYLHNPGEAYRPRSLSFPTGRGQAAVQSIRDLLRSLDGIVKATFDGDAFEMQKAEIVQHYQRQQQQRLNDLNVFAEERNFILAQSPSGFSFVPAVRGKALSQEEFDALLPEQQQVYAEHDGELAAAMEQGLNDLGRLQEEADRQLELLALKVVDDAVGPHFDALKSQFVDAEAFCNYLTEVRTAVAAQLSQRHVASPERANDGVDEPKIASTRSWFEDFVPNLIVDNKDGSGAPVVHEINPSYPNLLGKVEYRSEYGALVPDHHTIRSGAIHRANGGYLLINAQGLLSYPMAWEGLKRALQYRSIQIDEPAAQAGTAPAASLSPEPIPLDMKVVLIGDPETYYDLYSHDGAFAKLFKVRADFASDMPWTDENVHQIARFIRTRGEEERLRAFSLAAVAEVVEYASRLVEHKERLTTRFAHVADIVSEADYWAKAGGAQVVDRGHVQRAIDERRYRSSLYQEEVHAMMVDGTIMMSTSGRAVGQVNGLSVVFLGDYAFGRPSRITASAYLGSNGIINIEREVSLSGHIHDKSVLIIAGYLGKCYGQDKPLNLNASLAFEQSYEHIDGDSASAAELYALFSAIGDIPLDQGIAVTGSMNQHGEMQAVGGVPTKIEGFFDACQIRGLTGSQGVIIPSANVLNLMLRQDVVDAVAAGKFHIWAISDANAGFALLSGLPAGERGQDGKYSEGTFNARIDQRLWNMVLALTRFTHPSGEPAPRGRKILVSQGSQDYSE